jgi:putative transposase
LGKQKRFEIIFDLKDRFPIAWLTKIAKVSRAGYYKWLHEKERRMERENKDGDLKGHILAIHHAHPYYGYKRVCVALRREGLIVNQKKVRRLMRELGIRSAIRKRRPFYGRKSSVVFSNLLNQDFNASRPMEKLATDITYIRVGNSFVYLSAAIDLYNNEVVAWSMSKRNDLALVQATLDQLAKRTNVHQTILHSDQGFQYTSKSYARRLKDLGITGSHSRRGNCFDNACIESFFSHLKAEKLHLEHPNNLENALAMVDEYISFYNSDRFQAKLGERSPIEYREALVA